MCVAYIHTHTHAHTHTHTHTCIYCRTHKMCTHTYTIFTNSQGVMPCMHIRTHIHTHTHTHAHTHEDIVLHIHNIRVRVYIYGVMPGRFVDTAYVRVW